MANKEQRKVQKAVPKSNKQKKEMQKEKKAAKAKQTDFDFRAAGWTSNQPLFDVQMGFTFPLQSGSARLFQLCLNPACAKVHFRLRKES